MTLQKNPASLESSSIITITSSGSSIWSLFTKGKVCMNSFLMSHTLSCYFIKISLRTRYKSLPHSVLCLINSWPSSCLVEDKRTFSDIYSITVPIHITLDDNSVLLVKNPDGNYKTNSVALPDKNLLSCKADRCF